MIDDAMRVRIGWIYDCVIKLYWLYTNCYLNTSKLNRHLSLSKYSIVPSKLEDTSTADIIIVDGETEVARNESQIVLRITAAVPGDEIYGHLPFK